MDKRLRLEARRWQTPPVRRSTQRIPNIARSLKTVFLKHHQFPLKCAVDRHISGPDTLKVTPSMSTAKKHKKVSAETWSEALAAANDGMPLRTVARTYGVSREPLRQRFKGLVPLVTRRGPQLVYISERGDQGLVEMLQYRTLHGNYVDYDELRFMMRKVAEMTGTRPLTDDFPNDKYVSRWVAKHPQISIQQRPITGRETS